MRPPPPPPTRRQLRSQLRRAQQRIDELKAAGFGDMAIRLAGAYEALAALQTALQQPIEEPP